MKKTILFNLILGLILSFSIIKLPLYAAPYHSTKTTLENMTPQAALDRLIEGNKRFLANHPKQRNLLAQAKATALNGQFPAAVILSCMDSRGAPEILFDQGLGDVFSVRVAGNVLDKDQLGGMEFAVNVVGSKLLVILGHSACGAVKGACQHVTLGNLTQLLNKINPAVKSVQSQSRTHIDCNDNAIVDQIAKQNVINMIKTLQEQSQIIHDLAMKKQILIVGAMHQLKTGKVEFFDEDGKTIHAANEPH